MEIEELNALQWTPGAGQPMEAMAMVPVISTVTTITALSLSQNSFADLVRGADRLVQRYGPDSCISSSGDVMES